MSKSARAHIMIRIAVATSLLSTPLSALAWIQPLSVAPSIPAAPPVSTAPSARVVPPTVVKAPVAITTPSIKTAAVTSTPAPIMPKQKSEQSELTFPSAGVVQHGHGVVSGNAGYGSQIPLHNAMSMILPMHFMGIYGDKSVSLLPVSWHGGTWVHALKAIAKKHDLSISISWPEKMVTVTQIFGAPGTAAVEVNTPPNHGLPANFHIGKSVAVTAPMRPSTINAISRKVPAGFHAGTPVMVSSPTIHVSTATYVPPVFSAPKNSMLSSDIRKFLKKSGWNLAWNDPMNWPISESFDLTGSPVEVLSKLQTMYPLQFNGKGGNRTFVATPAPIN